jgi:hypothetical protein
MTTTLLVAAYTMWVWYYPDVGWEPAPQNYATTEECMAAIERWSNHLRGTALEAMDNDKAGRHRDGSPAGSVSHIGIDGRAQSPQTSASIAYGSRSRR